MLACVHCMKFPFLCRAYGVEVGCIPVPSRMWAKLRSGRTELGSFGMQWKWKNGTEYVGDGRSRRSSPFSLADLTSWRKRGTLGPRFWVAREPVTRGSEANIYFIQNKNWLQPTYGDIRIPQRSVLVKLILHRHVHIVYDLRSWLPSKAQLKYKFPLPLGDSARMSRFERGGENRKKASVRNS